MDKHIIPIPINGAIIKHITIAAIAHKMLKIKSIKISVSLFIYCKYKELINRIIIFVFNRNIPIMSWSFVFPMMIA